MYQGYAEGEFALGAYPFAGTLQMLAVARGVQARAGDALFALEKENETAARQEAMERMRSAQARLANLSATRRPPSRPPARRNSRRRKRCASRGMMQPAEPSAFNTLLARH
ncbi:MAG TPA: hypothetical protein VEV20_07380 [Burkholderiales bacterium]|nr:hypothetical protein [Burkholderiales bacterium]